MKPAIKLTRVWSNDDVLELKSEVSDGTSIFSTKVYLGCRDLDGVISGLVVFKDHVHGGILDIRLGEFGPEYAGGAFHARLHFAHPGKLFVTCRSESAYHEFSVNKVASQATLHLLTEPALLDNFILELESMNSKRRDEANLMAT